ncbi:hypothetical protein EKO04_008852 [Ascochyta lentis]|uniref:Uncharacterized protein n=1 Tax=Ascochyta lentis TaxID=205686 RepID=A0A8H7IX22_9PLEO|nr:hypothetical protein EKO04_008852 [Ascochyta lentis]
MAPIAKNNAFGAGSPSWNLSFPEGNLTAAEIIAYLPHWLKSVDVILRFVNNGGRSVTITHLLHKLRVMPSSNYQANSTTIMMHYAMRRAGYEEWTIGTRHEYEDDREYDENSLYVGDFRPPRITHPKNVSTKQKTKEDELARNCAADPIPFKDLALHVKKHPSGSDALDLTRCVDYALKHPKEQWLFPNDFQKLVKHLGGPLPVTHSHLDPQLFARCNSIYKAHGPGRLPAKYNKKSKPESEIDTDSDTEPKSKTVSKKASTKKTKKTKKVMREARGNVSADATPLTRGKREFDELEEGNDDGGGRRRSSRRVKTAPVYVDNDEDATDVDKIDADYATPHKKRKLSRVPPMPKEEESDFEAKEDPESDDDMLPVIDEAADEPDFATPTAARGRRLASSKARQVIQQQSSAVLMEQFRASAAAAKPAHKSFMDNSPGMVAAARAYEHRVPVYLTPPVLSANRMIIDPYTVYLYAQEGCRNEDELWASALSTYRFGGPRRHAPFRELYRLTEPMAWDTSDWAENIRWAKEQYKEFGVETWTEYDDHLERITRWRMQTLWVSEETVSAGM